MITRDYQELPAYVQEIIDCSNYAFDYAVEYDDHYTLCTESGFRFKVVQKQCVDEERNDVSSFFYYMWNAWCEEECARAFAGAECGWKHFWQKWLGVCNRNLHNHFGAVEEFFAELSEHYKDMLVRRAVETYDRGRYIWKQSI